MALTWVDIICECGGGGGWGCWGDGCDEGCVGGDGRIVELFCNKQRKRQTCSNTAIQATAKLEGSGMIVLILDRYSSTSYKYVDCYSQQINLHDIFFNKWDFILLYIHLISHFISLCII